MLSTVAFLQNIGGFEMLIIGVVALLIFGGRLPEVAKNAGKTITQFKRGLQEASEQVRREMEKAAAEADPTPEVKSTLNEVMADSENPKPDDYTSANPPGYDGYNYDGSPQAPSASTPVATEGFTSSADGSGHVAAGTADATAAVALATPAAGSGCEPMPPPSTAMAGTLSDPAKEAPPVVAPEASVAPSSGPTETPSATTVAHTAGAADATTPASETPAQPEPPALKTAAVRKMDAALLN